MGKDTDRSSGIEERLSQAAHESYRAAVDHAFDIHKSNMRLSRRFFENWMEMLAEHAQLNRQTAQDLRELVREQREAFERLSRESGAAYEDFIESLSSYYDEQLENPVESGDTGERADQSKEVSEVSVWRGTGQGAREDYLKLLERTGEMKRGSGELPADFWDLPRPADPGGLVRLAVQEERR